MLTGSKLQGQRGRGATGLRWSRQHAAVLRDSRWAFGDVSRKEAERSAEVGCRLGLGLF